ncbi:MAG: type II toxin-antitoxin system HicA family toxin [Candidatus Gracilibacteria bacterium]|nr:type II toxin-antitoxin system HicA family toxin [Candidatus Gracilibacteria bacterium]
MPYKYREIKKRLLKLGFKIVRQNGSHVIFTKSGLTFPVPNHGGKDISNGIENKIIKLLGETKESFRKIK